MSKTLNRILCCVIGYTSGLAIIRHIPASERDDILIGICVLLAVAIYEDINSKYFKDEV
jgi:hypothetical protein